jgi:hypothetical protein
MQMPPGSANPLQSGRNVHPIAIEVSAIDDHVAEIDPNAELNSFLRRNFGIALPHALLDLDRAADCIHDARKLDENAIARRFHDTTAVLLSFGVDQLSAIFLKARERACLICTHQPAIAGNVGSEYGGELAFDLIGSHGAWFPLRRIPSADHGNAAKTISHPAALRWKGSGVALGAIIRRPVSESAQLSRAPARGRRAVAAPAELRSIFAVAKKAYGIVPRDVLPEVLIRDLRQVATGRRLSIRASSPEKPAPQRTLSRKRSRDLRSGNARSLSWYRQVCQTKGWGGSSISPREPSKFTCTTFFRSLQ